MRPPRPMCSCDCNSLSRRTPLYLLCAWAADQRSRPPAPSAPSTLTSGRTLIRIQNIDLSERAIPSTSLPRRAGRSALTAATPSPAARPGILARKLGSRHRTATGSATVTIQATPAFIVSSPTPPQAAASDRLTQVTYSYRCRHRHNATTASSTPSSTPPAEALTISPATPQAPPPPEASTHERHDVHPVRWGACRRVSIARGTAIQGHGCPFRPRLALGSGGSGQWRGIDAGGRIDVEIRYRAMPEARLVIEAVAAFMAASPLVHP